MAYYKLLLRHQSQHSVPQNIQHVTNTEVAPSMSSQSAAFLSRSNRLAGLDPAQLLFEGHKKEIQLDADDALFVEVMHTDAKPTVPLLGAGVLRAVGKVNRQVEVITLPFIG